MRQALTGTLNVFFKYLYIYRVKILVTITNNQDAYGPYVSEI